VLIVGGAIFTARWASSVRFQLARDFKPLVRWSILTLGTKLVWIGDVEAASEAEAIAKGAEQFGQPKERLMAVRRG